MNLNELSNAQVLFLYFTNKSIYDSYTQIIEEKMYKSSLELFDMGSIVINNYLHDQEIKELEESDHFRYLMELDLLLEPIASLIEEADPDLYRDIKSTVDQRF